MLRLFVALFCLLIAAPAVSHAADTVAPVKKEKTQGFKPKNKPKRRKRRKKKKRPPLSPSKAKLISKTPRSKS